MILSEKLILHIIDNSWVEIGIYNEYGSIKDIFSFLIKKNPYVCFRDPSMKK